MYAARSARLRHLDGSQQTAQLLAVDYSAHDFAALNVHFDQSGPVLPIERFVSRRFVQNLGQGLKARFIEGGIEAWKAAGGSTAKK
ncbi:MAG: hypothetical protein AAB252_06310 [Pseudomonadota bacterium]